MIKLLGIFTLVIWSISMPTLAKIIDLNKDTQMKGQDWTFNKYTETLNNEQIGSLNYLDSPDIVWNIPESLTHKVFEDGVLKPFFGDTTVFELTKKEVSKISPLIDKLESIRDFLAEPLDSDHLHLTLHDLSNSPIEGTVDTEMSVNHAKISKLFPRIKKYIEENPEYRKIKMVSTNAFPCLNISILLGFAPKTEKDFKALINLYNLFDDVVYIDHWLRPHVTLSYFKPKVLDKDQIGQLSTVLKEINSHKVEIELDILELVYQRFYDMNQYETIFTLKEK